MSRRIRMLGSGNDGCPTPYEIEGTGQYLVQADAVTDSGEPQQLANVTPRESAAVVSRELLANFGPKTPVPTREPISFEAFVGMFSTLRHSAWRLETRRRYASDDAAGTYAEFLRTGSASWDLVPQPARAQSYGEAVRACACPGRAPDRGGQRYLLDNARRNRTVGEDIRILTRSRAEKLHLPAEDFWIFDSRVVALLQFNDNDEMTGVELIANPAEVVRTCRARGAAWHYATTTE